MKSLKDILCFLRIHDWKWCGRYVEPLFTNKNMVGFGENWYDLYKCDHCGKEKKGWDE